MARSTEWMRLLDRAGGVVAVQLLAAGRRRKALPDTVRKIGIIMPPAIGDTILGSGVFLAIIDRYPKADLVFFHGMNNASAAKLIPVKMMCIESPFTNPLAMIPLLRKAKLDMMVDLSSWAYISAIYARLGAPITIGYNLPGQRRHAAFDITVRHRDDIHELDNYAAVAALFSDRPYRIDVVTECFENHEGLELDRLILCHTSAGGRRAADKAWPAENWANLTRRLAAKGWQIGFTGTKADASLVERILADAALPSDQALSLCGRVPLPQLGELIRNARLLITIDTGVLHLAAAVDAQIVALHGPTRSACWGARSSHAASLNSNHPAAGYIRYGYESHPLGYETMLAHTVNDVANAAFNQLDQLDGKQPSANSVHVTS